MYCQQSDLIKVQCSSFVALVSYRVRVALDKSVNTHAMLHLDHTVWSILQSVRVPHPKRYCRNVSMRIQSP